MSLRFNQPPFRINGPDSELFLLPKPLLCKTSTFFKAALEGSFIESQEQKITLDDEDPAVFRTYATWLYEGELGSKAIRRAFPDVKDCAMHIVSVYAFADKRGIATLQNDAVSLLLDLLCKIGLAPKRVINKVFELPSTKQTTKLRCILIHEELFFGDRIKSGVLSTFPPRFVSGVLDSLYVTGKPAERIFFGPRTYCLLGHVHDNGGREECGPKELAKNLYDGPTTVKSRASKELRELKRCKMAW